ncbi:MULTISPECIES: hypothetical protein [unclassified Nocardia]|uniref:hypothetical protein n=1 Tax=unclassified Nocardia TaxID=2637762 RepID=UPI001CE4343C|nr:MULTISPECIES: hypothetical protein [unclassified Nocardia]
MSKLAAELQRLEMERCTGILRAGDGAFHLVSGMVAAADCRRTPGLERLAVAAGVASAADLLRARTGSPHELTGVPRLESLALLSVFDAAYLLLATPSAPEFQPAPPHWLAAACHIPPRALVRECARRGDPAAGPWPVDLIDRAPVVPVHRIRRRRLVLTGGQVEVLAAADARRTIAALARELGRTTYGCLLAVRALTAAGLIEPPLPAAITEPAPPARPETERLPRRHARHAAPDPVPNRWAPVDHNTLIRLRAALEGLA